MSEEAKKDRRKNDPKEQRKPRKGGGRAEKKTDKQEEHKSSSIKVPQKPVYEDPGPEFYKNLKRETDEIVKITEEEHSKYKKKEIQSNWGKYEMPIDSYDDIEEQDPGADYEKLIQMPLSIGGHFQFKHEKSWDTTAGPSPYDKYFDLNMDNLSIAISTIPFYERNNLKESIFTETDILSMNNRATKYKQKFYNDKKYSTPEMEAEERILGLLKDNNNEPSLITETVATNLNEIEIEETQLAKDIEESDVKECKTLEDEKTIMQENKEITEPCVVQTKLECKKIDFDSDKTALPAAPKSNDTKDILAAPKANPVIQSPEDLEKWLDDFLDS